MTGSDQATPGYNQAIPDKILTPDRVETPIGTLEFFDGMPTDETVTKVFDNLDLLRGVETFLNGMPATSLAGLNAGLRGIGIDTCNKICIFAMLDSNGLFLTGNTDTVYAITTLDLGETGPVVFEIPPKCGPGTVDDAFFRFVVDMGAPGPDRGKGGKYLILPPDDPSDLDPPLGGMEAVVDGETYFVARSTTYNNFVALRGFLVDGKPDAAVAMFTKGLKIYPLAQAANPPEMEFRHETGTVFNTIHANNFEFFEELFDVIDREPVGFLEPELRGLFASIGIEKGKPFTPDARMTKILTDAVAIGNATARALALRSREPSDYFFPDSAWYACIPGGSYEWLKDGGAGGRNLDARSMFFYQATLNTPAMMLKMVGLGSQYAGASVDSDGNPLDGAKAYRLNIPADVPAKDFWSVVVYDTQTRSMLQTSQPLPGRNNKTGDLVLNADGSVDLYFGPAAPPGHEANWIETVPGKSWFTYFRLYGPLDAWFDQTWRPGEIELVV
jgi:hypothetical protein